MIWVAIAKKHEILEDFARGTANTPLLFFHMEKCASGTVESGNPHRGEALPVAIPTIAEFTGFSLQLWGLSLTCRQLPAMSVADPEFCKLLAGCHEVDLIRLMLELAVDAYPELDRVGCLMELDRLGAACRTAVERIPCAQHSERLRAISQVLFQVEGFHGNREDYYEPENSYLNQVLERRTGLPITLGIVYMAVASRAGLKMFGTNTPGHFVVGCLTHGEPLFIDAFSHGEVLDRPSCVERIVQMVGKPGVVTDVHFRPASAHDIVCRVLRNLKTAYGMRESWRPLLAVQRRLVALLPDVADERRDLGQIALRAGLPCEACQALEVYGKLVGGELDAESQAALKVARKMVAELN